MEVNTALVKFMAENNITVTELARVSGLDKSAVSRIVRGMTWPKSKATLDAIIAHCRKYDATVTYEDLFGSAA